MGLGQTVPMLTKGNIKTGSDSVTVCLEPAVAWETTIHSPETRPCRVHYLYVCVVLALLAIMRSRKELGLPNEETGSFVNTAATLDQCMVLAGQTCSSIVYAF